MRDALRSLDADVGSLNFDFGSKCDVDEEPRFCVSTRPTGPHSLHCGHLQTPFLNVTAFLLSSASYSASSFLDCIMRVDRPDRIPLAPPPCDWRSVHIASARMIWFSKIARSI